MCQRFSNLKIDINKLIDIRLKFLGSFLLSDFQPDEIIVPTSEEWHGLNSMDRDGELKRKETQQ